MRIKGLSIAMLTAVFMPGAWAQETPMGTGTQFGPAVVTLQQQLRDASAELDALRERIKGEKLPTTTRLSDLERQLSDARAEFQQISRTLDGRTLDVANLQNEIKQREDEAAYLTNLLSEYGRNLESRMHVAEFQRYREVLDAASSASQGGAMNQDAAFADQIALVTASLDRIEESLDLTRFEGTALDERGVESRGRFMLAGPVGLFRSDDGSVVGTVEQRLNSSQPAVIVFTDPADAQAAASAVAGTGSVLPLDPTLGDAHKIAETEETLWEHIQKGGAVMYPIFLLAGVALLVALGKWIALMFVRSPSHKRLMDLLAAVSRRDLPRALAAAEAVGGPTGKMLTAGVEHLNEPRDLIEEVLYEHVLSTRLKAQRFLPFVAVSAGAAPLLGLLGTVTGIITTFKLITVFGTGDVKMLSGGISEALITTEYGLYVAIPCLLSHALLSRKARGVVDQMEKAAIAFLNEVARSGSKPPLTTAA